LSKKDMSWQNHILNNTFKNNFKIIEDFDEKTKRAKG